MALIPTSRAVLNGLTTHDALRAQHSFLLPYACPVLPCLPYRSTTLAAEILIARRRMPPEFPIHHRIAQVKRMRVDQGGKLLEGLQLGDDRRVRRGGHLGIVVNGIRFIFAGRRFKTVDSLLGASHVDHG